MPLSFLHNFYFCVFCFLFNSSSCRKSFVCCAFPFHRIGLTAADAAGLIVFRDFRLVVFSYICKVLHNSNSQSESNPTNVIKVNQKSNPLPIFIQKIYHFCVPWIHIQGGCFSFIVGR